MKTELLRACASAMVIAAAISVSSQAFAAADEASSPQADEAEATSGDIVVTAQRRTERLRDVPISVSVVGGEQLARIT
jgi:iron complex outermembrane receptor protein